MISLKRISVGFMAASCLWAQTVMTNQSILQMTGAGMSEDVIFGVVTSQPGVYSTKAEDVAVLQNAGVSPRILAAVLVRAQNGQAQYSFSISNDPMTGKSLVLPDGTPVRLRLTRTLSSASALTGETIDFEVLDDIRVGDAVVIPRSSRAIGTITEAEHKKRMARGGKLNIAVEYIRLNSNTKIALRSINEYRGGGHAGAMTGAIVATSLLISLPAAPLFLLMHGKDAVIPEATEFTAYTNGDVQLNSSDLRASR